MEWMWAISFKMLYEGSQREVWSDSLNCFSHCWFESLSWWVCHCCCWWGLLTFNSDNPFFSWLKFSIRNMILILREDLDYPLFFFLIYVSSILYFFCWCKLLNFGFFNLHHVECLMLENASREVTFYWNKLSVLKRKFYLKKKIPIGVYNYLKSKAKKLKIDRTFWCKWIFGYKHWNDTKWSLSKNYLLFIIKARLFSLLYWDVRAKSEVFLVPVGNSGWQFQRSFFYSCSRASILCPWDSDIKWKWLCL